MPARDTPMADRYFVETKITGDRALLVEEEARHLARVMRARPGDRVTLFDGSGVEYTARVTELRRDEVELKIVARDQIDRELPFRLRLAVALPKGDRQRWLVEKAVELGVAQITPLRTARSIAQPGEKALRRMTRWVIDASKQCGRNRLMEIARPQTWSDLLADSAAVGLRIYAHPGGKGQARADRVDPTASDVLAAVGPEGGFTPDEVDAARRAGWQPIDLGPRTLRVETAAVVLATLLAASHGVIQ